MPADIIDIETTKTDCHGIAANENCGNIDSSSVVAVPMMDNTDASDVTLSNMVIQKVIDEICPSILPQIRTNLGLTKNAFLIPHDAHEALSSDPYNMLCGEQFLTVRH